MMIFSSLQAAMTASLLVTLSSLTVALTSFSIAAEFDADCGEGYTGFALKLGTQCRSYVYCTAGKIDSTTLCPGSLIYDGKAGVGGVCGWSNVVACSDPDFVPNSTSTTTTTTTTTATQATAEAVSSQLINNEPSPSPPSTSSTYVTLSSPSTPTQPTSGAGYCGPSRDEAEALCIPCIQNMCKDSTHACWFTACSSSNTDSVVSQPNPPTTATYTLLSPSSSTATTNTETVSVPSKSKTLPPWTNAPFTPYAGPPREKTVIGYYASWQWYDRDKAGDPQNIDFGKYDRINYAFFQTDKQGEIYGTDEWADPQLLWGPYIYDEANQIQSGVGANYYCSWDGPSLRNCNFHDTSKGLIDLVHKAGATVMPSIGGWTLSDTFPTVAASEMTRQNFARNCVRLITEYGFDGIDIDWEYPGYEDHSGTPNDKYTYTLFLAEIRKQLDELGRINGKYYKLTAALPCGPDKIANIEVDKIKDVLDELNLMSYDLHGAWDALTGVNAPMFDQGWSDLTPRWSVHGCTNTYEEFGVPLSKINIGLPFYGRSFRRATGMKQFHDGADDVNFHLDEGSPQYFNIVNDLKRMTTYRHQNTQTQYAVFNDANGGLVSYDDPRAICDKVHYANQRGMNGFLIWEISGDLLDNGETPLIDATNNKINDPNLDCSKLRDPLWALSTSTYLYAPDEPDEIDWNDAPSTLQSSGSENDYNGAQSISRPASASTSGGDESTQSQQYTQTYTVDTGSSPGANFVQLAPSITKGTNDCPMSFTGYWASSDCTRYFQCQDGSMVGATQPCVPGTLFDVSINTCALAGNVKC